MKSPAALAGAILLLATAGGSFAQVSGSSIQVTGGASPQVTAAGGDPRLPGSIPGATPSMVAASSTSTSTSGSSSQSSSDPTILGSGNAAGSANQTGNIRSTNRNSARGGNATAQGGQGGRSVSASRGGTGQAVGNQVLLYQGSGGGGGGAPAYTGADPYVGVNTTNYTGGYTQTLRNVPEIVAPSVNGGANGCAVGLSGGVSVAGFGVTTGAGWSDPDCERRNLAALAYNTGEKDLAQEILCDAKEVRAARLRLGKPCAADRPPTPVVALTQTQPLGAIDPAILRREQDSAASTQPPRPPAPMMTVGGAAPVAVTAAVNRKPDWCETASQQELRSHKECD